MEITKSVLFLLLFLFSTNLTGQNTPAPTLEPYFCTHQGMSIEYTRREPDGKVKWYHQMKIISVPDNVLNGETIYTSLILSPKRKSRFEKPLEVTAYIKNGAVEIELGLLMVNIFKSVAGESLKVTATGARTVLPYIMKKGERLPNASTAVKTFGMTMNVDVTERKIIGLDTLTTDVGVFPCVIVQEHKVEKGMGRNRVTTANTWYARGMGMVRHDTYDKNGQLESIELITKIEK